MQTWYLEHISVGGSHGVMVSTLDSESSDPSSNLGGTLQWYASSSLRNILFYSFHYAKYIKYLDCYLYALPPQFTQTNPDDLM